MKTAWEQLLERFFTDPDEADVIEDTEFFDVPQHGVYEVTKLMNGEDE